MNMRRKRHARNIIPFLGTVLNVTIADTYVYTEHYTLYVLRAYRARAHSYRSTLCLYSKRAFVGLRDLE